MFWIVVFVLMLTACLFVVKPLSVYNGVFLAEVVSLVIMIGAFLISYNIFSSYDSASWFELFVRSIITKYSMPLYGVKTLVNVAVIFHMLSSAILCSQRNVIVKGRYGFVFYGIFFALLAAILLKYNSAFYAEKIFISLSDEQTALKARIMQDFVLSLDSVCVAIFSLLAAVNLSVSLAKTDVIFKKRRLTAVFLAEIVKLAGIIVFLYATPLRFFWGYMDLYDFGILYNGFRYKPSVGIIVAVLAAVFLAHAAVIATGEPELRKTLKKYAASRARSLCVDDIYHIFHTYKNAMFSVIVMSDMALSKSDAEDIKQMVMKIRKCAENYKNHTAAFLNTSGRAKSMPKPFNVADCIARAETMLALPDNIRIDKEFDCADSAVCGYGEDITSAFLNLFTNAVEAIGTKENGCISVRVWREDSAVCVNVRDNGSGIKRKDLRKTLIPLYTTKKTNKNWGLGLSQVQKAVYMHNGQIDVKSKNNCYTLFQLYIPTGVLEAKEDNDD